MKSVVPSTQLPDDDDTGDSENGALLPTLRFTYRHITTLVVVSLIWALLSVPIVTVGPATLGLYCAIVSLRETGEIEPNTIYSTVRSNFLSAFLFGLIPLLFSGIGLLYLTTSAGEFGSLSLVLGAGGLYIGLYLIILLVPTFYAMAQGDDSTKALRTGYVFIARDPVTAVQLMIMTLGFFLLSVLLTIAIILIFPAITAAYHVHLIELKLAATDGP